MRVYIAREDALEFDLEDIVLGVFNSRIGAIECCNGSKCAWSDVYNVNSDSGWIVYNEQSEGGWTREINMAMEEDDDESVDHWPKATLKYKIYECEVQ